MRYIPHRGHVFFCFRRRQGDGGSDLTVQLLCQGEPAFQQRQLILRTAVLSLQHPSGSIHPPFYRINVFLLLFLKLRYTGPDIRRTGLRFQGTTGILCYPLPGQGRNITGRSRHLYQPPGKICRPLHQICQPLQNLRVPERVTDLRDGILHAGQVDIRQPGGQRDFHTIHLRRHVLKQGVRPDQLLNIRIIRGHTERLRCRHVLTEFFTALLQQWQHSGQVITQTLKDRRFL